MSYALHSPERNASPSGNEDPLQIRSCKAPYAGVTMLLCTRATRACMHALTHGGAPYTPHA